METTKRLAQPWQYWSEQFHDVLEVELDRELNKLGEQGWELVSAQWSNDWASVACVFKKPK